jgi:hypothetical protein
MRRIVRALHCVARYADLYARLLYLHVLNRFGRASITSRDGPVVSLTTYGQRAQTVHLAIESIARGQVRPSRLILWIDEEYLEQHPSAGLRRLQNRGLEIKLCMNLGPHKKYYPYVQSSEELAVPLVTADDDLLYPHTWLKKLVEEFEKHPEVVNCYRARVMELNDKGLANYSQWEFARSTRASFRHFAGSGAGAIYPVPLQRALKREGTWFMSCCPKADDIWLHLQAIRAGYKIRQIEKRQFRIVCIPRTQEYALWNSNVSGNDYQVRATYSAADTHILRDEALLSARGVGDDACDEAVREAGAELGTLEGACGGGADVRASVLDGRDS